MGLQSHLSFVMMKLVVVFLFGCLLIASVMVEGMEKHVKIIMPQVFHGAHHEAKHPAVDDPDVKGQRHRTQAKSFIEKGHHVAAAEELQLAAVYYNSVEQLEEAIRMRKFAGYQYAEAAKHERAKGHYADAAYWFERAGTQYALGNDYLRASTMTLLAEKEFMVAASRPTDHAGPNWKVEQLGNAYRCHESAKDFETQSGDRLLAGSVYRVVAEQCAGEGHHAIASMFYKRAAESYEADEELENAAAMELLAGEQSALVGDAPLDN